MEQLEAFIASAASDLTSQPLSTLFLHSRTINQNQDALVTRARQQPALLDKSLAVCRQLVASVESAALFSANEELDDIATGDIKFLLAPFYLAELLGSCPAPDGPTQRLRQVQEAHSAYNSFLHRCQHYGLLGELGSKLYKTMEEQVRMWDHAPCEPCRYCYRTCACSIMMCEGLAHEAARALPVCLSCTQRLSIVLQMC